MYAVTKVIHAHTVCSNFSKKKLRTAANPEENLGLYGRASGWCLRKMPWRAPLVQCCKHRLLWVSLFSSWEESQAAYHMRTLREACGAMEPQAIFTLTACLSPSQPSPTPGTCPAEQAWERLADSRCPSLQPSRHHSLAQICSILWTWKTGWLQQEAYMDQKQPRSTDSIFKIKSQITCRLLGLSLRPRIYLWARLPWMGSEPRDSHGL